MVGQDHIARTLGNAIAQDRVHHAYLFAGARGLGKTTTARIFAKGLVCEKGPTAEPCNECNECVAVNEGRSVDVTEIDGASNNSVDNIRQLREQVNYLPQTARRKVYIIDEVHMLSTSAFNALLKTLEEPPPHVNFVFATTEPQKVLPTILSRVNRLDFHRVTIDQQVAHLQSILDREEAKVEEGGLRLVSRAAGGSVRDALTLLDQVVAFSDDPREVKEAEVRELLGQADRAAVARLVDAVLDADPAETMKRYDALLTAGHDVTVLSMQVLEHLRDLAVYRVCRIKDVLPDATDAELAEIETQSTKVDAAHLGQLFDRFSRIVDRLQTSRMQRMLVQMGLLDLAASGPVVPLGDLVDQLNVLASGGTPTGSGGSGGRAAPRGRGGAPSRGSSQRSAAPSAPTPEASASPETPQPPGATAPAGPTPTAAPPSPRPTPTTPQSPPPTTAPQAPAPASSSAPPQTPAAEAPAPPPQAPAAPSSAFAADLWKMAQGIVDENGAPTSDSKPADASPARPQPHSGPAPAPATSPPTNGQPQAAARPSIPVCEPPPPADGVIPWETLEPFAAWEALLGRIRAMDDFLCAVLEQVGLVSLGDGVIRVAATRHSFPHTELSQHADKRATVEQATRDHLGAPFRIELVEAEPGLPDRPSLVLVAEQRRAEHRAQIEAEARADPRLQSVLDAFNGSLTRIKPLHEP